MTGRVTPNLSRVRARAATLAAIVTIGAFVVIVPGVAAPADDLEAQRERARELAAQIEANGTRVEILDEQYNQARIEVSRLQEQIQSGRESLQTTEQDQRELKALLAKRAVELYTEAGGNLAIPQFNDADIQTAGARSQYMAVAQEDDHRLIDQIENIQDELHKRNADLDDQLARAEQLEAATAHSRDEVIAAQAEQKALLGEVQGEIASLVHEEEQRRAAAEEAAARRALEASRTASDDSARSGDDGSSSSGSRPTHEELLPPPPPVSSAAGQAVATARAQLGKPYQYAAAGPDSFDCSGLTMYAWASAGVSLPHSSAAQYTSLPHVSMSDLQPGYLVFYGSPIHHVGIYAGGGTYIHAPQTGDVVKASSIYRSDYRGAARPG